MYAMRCTLTREATGPHYWTEAAAKAAWGQSELLAIESTEVDTPANMDMGLRAQQARRNLPFDPQGHWRRLVENMLAALEYQFRTGSRALWDFYFRGGAKPTDTELV